SLILLMMPHPPTSLLFPSTTLFRSDAGRVLFYLQCAECRFEMPETVRIESKGGALEPLTHDDGGQLERSLFDFVHRGEYNDYERSEEHTSELQSRENLVCRLLLEKK